MATHLCESGARVIGFGRNDARNLCSSGTDCGDRYTFVKGSLGASALLEETIRKFGVDTVFHLAAQSKVDLARRNPTETFETNIQGTWNVLEAVRCAGTKIRVLLASTEMVYGDSLPSEAGFADGLSPYAASKVCAELLAKSYHRTYGIPVCIVRTSNLYGGGDLSFERIIPGAIRAVIRGESPVINGNGLQERDYLYIEDAISGYTLLAAAMEDDAICGETFNFSTGALVTVSKVVKTILALMERTDLKPRVLGGSASPSVKASSSSKAKEKLGWSAGTSLEAGLTKTIAWYRAHTNELRLEAQN